MIKPAHIIHSIPTWQGVQVKRALMRLYKAQLLQGITRANGIVLAQKINRQERLSDEEMSALRIVVRHHANELANLNIEQTNQERI